MRSIHNSGKSTLLRLIAGMELPTQGCVSINGHKITQLHDGEAKGQRMPNWIKVGKVPPTSEKKSLPVILDGKPDFDDSLTVLERIMEMRPDDNMAQSEHLANDFANLLGLDGQCSLFPSQLSPSEQYLFSIACACMVSVAPAATKERNDDDDNGIPYPILLLDELFDTEVPSTVEKCSKGITNLIECGGVVVSATHRPNYFKGMSKRVVTLSGGKVLTDITTS